MQNQVKRVLGYLLVGAIGVALGVVISPYGTSIALNVQAGGLESAAAIAAIASAIATILLTLITAWYASLTRNLVDETQESRQQEIIPVFDLDVEYYALDSMGVVLKNIGNGPAGSVQATLSLHPGDVQTKIRNKNVRAGSFIGIVDPIRRYSC